MLKHGFTTGTGFALVGGRHKLKMAPLFSSLLPQIMQSADFQGTDSRRAVETLTVVPDGCLRFPRRTEPAEILNPPRNFLR